MSFDLDCMALAIAEARKCKSDGSTPLVGAVAALDGSILATAYRGEFPDPSGDHAEFVLLEGKLHETPLNKATIFTTLEPCTRRNPPKIPCAQRLTNRKVARVVIGMLDPNPVVRGLGVDQLRTAGIPVEFFPHDLMRELEELNHSFREYMEADQISQSTLQIVRLARSGKSSAGLATNSALKECIARIEQINRGEIHIGGGEADYFGSLLRHLGANPDIKNISCFINLSSFHIQVPIGKWKFSNFIKDFEDSIKSNAIMIDYIFYVNASPMADDMKKFLQNYRRFASSIKILDSHESPFPFDVVEKSIVIIHETDTVFTHRRNTSGDLCDPIEWSGKNFVEKFKNQLSAFRLASVDLEDHLNE